MPVKVIVTGGTAADCSQALPLIEGIAAEHLLADKAYDTNEIIAKLITAQEQPARTGRAVTGRMPRTLFQFHSRNYLQEMRMKSALEAQQVLRWLMIVRWIALADLVLLIVLLVASFANNEKMVQIFGLTHGIVFLALIAIVGIGAVQKLWTWWFLVGTLVTTGPPGALVGEVLIARKAKAILVTSKGETTDR